MHQDEASLPVGNHALQGGRCCSRGRCGARCLVPGFQRTFSREQTPGSRAGAWGCTAVHQRPHLQPAKALVGWQRCATWNSRIRKVPLPNPSRTMSHISGIHTDSLQSAGACHGMFCGRMIHMRACDDSESKTRRREQLFTLRRHRPLTVLVGRGRRTSVPVAHERRTKGYAL